MKGLILVFLSLTIFAPSNKGGISKCRFNGDTLNCMFDSLSMKDFQSFVEKSNIYIDNLFSFYWGNFRQVKDLDTIFNILTLCNFSLNVEAEELSLYVYVTGELVDNKNVDGYVSEFLCDKYYSLFRNHPKSLLRYLRSVDKQKRETIMNYIGNGIYYADISDEDLNAIFEYYSKNYENYKNEIDELRKVYYTIGKSNF